MDDDFERRRELRRQKREEMRLEAERMANRRNEEDEEEAARERRRRARQERLRGKDGEDVAYQPETPELNNSHSVTVTESVSTSVVSSSGTGEGDDEEQALLERLAKREERRQKRMMEALDRQQELESNQTLEESRSYEPEEEEKQVEEEEEEVIPREEEEEVVVEKPRRSYLREQESAEEVSKIPEEMEDEDVVRKNKQPNGGVCEDSAPKHKKAERTFSRGSVRSPEAPEADDADGEDARLEAERKLEELKRRRDEMEIEEFERMRQKQQEAEVELEELKKKREERRKVLEEEERRRKQEEAEMKAREEEEKRRMKEEIEKRRAEAAEKRQKVEDSEEGEGRKPFKCVSPRGSSLKIGERAEFLNRSAQKSSVKASHSPVVSKIDNRLEQYTSAVQGQVRSPRSAAIDLPVVTDGIRNIKSMWEKGNVFSSGGSPASTNKDAAGIKVGVAGRINDWLNKTPETGKMSGGRPADLKPGDVTSKRSLWENKGSSATKVTSRGETKSVTNGTGH
ncbi:non-muscle caldesmon-like isoform X2 [Carassius auratus]|uniref:Non-muscle caldesmon-like isoform X2 n=1 Tax=Carassius auratus TaxID=7957 RepID=A0A6P6K080_CARAU|nr:non-muscle caldesmon-like isoform X2 [Carassius auratus]XP_052438562.1 non-muscle caldesmon isoform X2 [Carassius gibelio]